MTKDKSALNYRIVAILIAVIVIAVAVVLIIDWDKHPAGIGSTGSGSSFLGGVWFGVRHVPSGSGNGGPTGTMEFEINPATGDVSAVKVNNTPTGQTGSVTASTGGAGMYEIWKMTLSGGSGGAIEATLMVRKEGVNQPAQVFGWVDNQSHLGCFTQRVPGDPACPGNFTASDFQSTNWAGRSFNVDASLTVTGNHTSSLTVAGNLAFTCTAATTVTGALPPEPMQGNCFGTYIGSCQPPNPSRGTHLMSLSKRFGVMIAHPGNGKFPEDCPVHCLTKQ